MRTAGILWIIGGLTSALVAFFLTDPVDLALFIGGAVLGTATGIALLLRPSPAVVTASSILGLAWAVGYGVMSALNLGLPLEQLLSVVWILAFGVAGALVARLRARPAS